MKRFDPPDADMVHNHNLHQADHYMRRGGSPRIASVSHSASINTQFGLSAQYASAALSFAP